MTDPRYIFEVTGQMSQYGPWGIRLPDGPGQTDATLYFKSKEEAEEYMREHPVEDGVRCKCGCTPDNHALINTTYVYCMANDCDCLMFRPPIPPTSAPWSEGGYGAESACTCGFARTHIGKCWCPAAPADE